MMPIATPPPFKKKLKLRRIFQTPHHDLEQEAAFLEHNTSTKAKNVFDTRALQVEAETKSLPERSATPPLAPAPSVKSPPRLEPSAKDSRKKERPYPVSVRKQQNNTSTLDPPATVREMWKQRQHEHEFVSTATATANKTKILEDLKLISVKERIQHLQLAKNEVVVGSNVEPAEVPKQSEVIPPPQSEVRPVPQPSETPMEEVPNEELIQVRKKEEEEVPQPTQVLFQDQIPTFQRRKEEPSPQPALPQQDEDATEARSVTPQRQPETTNDEVHDTPVKANRTEDRPPSEPEPEEVSLPEYDEAKKAALSRPFGRPPTQSDQWVVEVSAAEWDGDEQRWKYRILVQKRQTTQKSFTNAFTWRSVSDFFWLEQALHNEFHGALLIPVLSIALGRTATVATEMPVESDKLKLWISDVLNGIRGNGEWNVEKTNIMENCESVETFLYRNVIGTTLHDTERELDDDNEQRFRCDDNEDGCCNEQQRSVLESLSACMPLDLCVGAQPTTEKPKKSKSKKALQSVMNCSSKALGTARELDVGDSLAESSTHTTDTAIASTAHSALLYAERDLAANYKKTAIVVLEKLSMLSQEEERVGLAWKRFASSLINLFAFEKDVESASFGDVKLKIPYRKVSREVVEESLNAVMARKADRSFVALDQLREMVNSYVADLSAVEPSLEAYTQGLKNLSKPTPSVTENSIESVSSEKSWALRESWLLESLQRANLASPARKENKKSAKPTATLRRRNSDLRNRLVANENLLKISVSAMFEAVPFRIARMAWRLWHTEVSAAAKLRNAAASMRIDLDVVSQSSISKVLKRHARDEKGDHSLEMEIIQKIVNLGTTKKFNYDSEAESTTSINNELVEVDNDDLSAERSKAHKRDKALDMSRQKIGRWDATLAMAIMEAVNVDDPNVRVEETTRDLRLVRKYAIGLRENLDRCVEAVQMLQQAISGDDDDENRLKSMRLDFLRETCALFSGTFAERRNLPRPSLKTKSLLLHAGIDTSDPQEWLPSANNTSRGKKLGDLAKNYIKSRDAQVEWLLSSLLDLLNEYYQRIEVIEGFVYMECVGIQLEKNFSTKRSKTLAVFEKKADLTAALTKATKKGKRSIANELRQTLEKLHVSHTQVKETKEAHLESKTLKANLHELAMRRLNRARELSTERVLAILSLLAKEEELNSSEEIKALGEAIKALESTVYERLTPPPTTYLGTC